MERKGNSYTFIFACIICVVCSFLLALVSEGLKPYKELNESLDVKKNILKAVRLQNPLPAKATAKDVTAVYEQKIEELVIDRQGNVIKGRLPDQLNLERESLYFPLFVYKEEGKVIAYCFPVVGKGLWSTLYGYFSLEADAKTVRGITFYKHKETPGLGGEIEKDWFQSNFKGKSVWSAEKEDFVPLEVVKGKVEDFYPDGRALHAVDGISGATMTSKGVAEMLREWLVMYKPFLEKTRLSQKN